jgi:AcrR family transcriptional regulator
VEVVLEAAARVLVERGYASATTNRIASEAGVSVGTVYEYFADKEEIYGALIRQELERLVTRVSSQPREPDAPIDVRLGRTVQAAMEAMRYGPSFYRSLEQVPNATFRLELREARAAVVAFVRGLLAEHRAELRVDDLDLAAFVVVSAIEGVGANASEEVFDERLARELTDLVRAYLVGTAPA